MAADELVPVVLLVRLSFTIHFITVHQRQRPHGAPIPMPDPSMLSALHVGCRVNFLFPPIAPATVAPATSTLCLGPIRASLLRFQRLFLLWHVPLPLAVVVHGVSFFTINARLDLVIHIATVVVVVFVLGRWETAWRCARQYSETAHPARGRRTLAMDDDVAATTFCSVEERGGFGRRIFPSTMLSMI